MNFLQIVQRLSRECDVSGTIPSTLNQIGESRLLVDWVNSAWMDIQSVRPDWDWLRTSLTPFATVAGQSLYSPTVDIGLTDFGDWVRDSFRVYDTSAGINSETFLSYIPYEEWRDGYLYGSLRTTTSRPVSVTVSPSKSLCFGPITAAGYSVVGDYYKLASEMTADANVPSLPAQFHMAIVYRAMMFYGAFNSAADVYQRGESEFRRMMLMMNSDSLPEVTLGGSL